ncbi:glycosyltransferase [Patescibacteria group bacterium]|nr:glycosyltransferase [Patescibacteria group bacterium]MBU4162008.1 glycosyltransferase [Patescibacteria group bacterium]
MIKFFKIILKKLVYKLPDKFQKNILLAWFNFKKIPSIFERSIRTKELYSSVESKKIRLIGFLKIYNEANNGNLERVLKHMQKFCDDIVVCDCESTDGSADIARRFTKHVLREPNDFKNELFIKQKMLVYALKFNPDWIVWLDADEVFDRKGELFGIRNLCLEGEKRNIDGFSFKECNLWRSVEQYRVDEFWNKGWFVRLWRNNGSLEFENKTGLHNIQNPNGLRKIKKTDIKVIHYGFSSTELIEKKYQLYKESGQTGFNLERLKDGDNVELNKINSDIFPFSTLKISIVCLVYKSISYIDFVWKSFQKYTKDAEFLFIANDATEKVKNYLRENNLPHLIFENEDKNEYYLKRVYRAWNFGGFNAPGDIIVFINSDMAFSENWLENLLKNLKRDRIVCSRLVESGKMPSGKHGISKNFGQTHKEYQDNEFQKYAKEISKPELRKCGLFMPCAIYKDSFIKSGGYPIGNRKESNGRETSGDHILFYEKLKPMGIEHYTAFDSIVYHVQEGEMDD